MKTILYALIGFGFLVVAAVLLGPSFVDWTPYRNDIAAHLSEATGRDVSIEGPVELSMLPTPAIALGDVTVRTRSEGRNRTRDALMRARTVRIDLRARALLGGQVRLGQVTLVKPDVRLGWQSGDGLAGLLGAAGAPEAGASPAGRMPLGADLRIDRVRIVDGTLGLRDPQDNRRLRLTALNGVFEMQQPGGPLTAEGGFLWRGLPLRFDSRVGRFTGGRDVPFGLNLRPESESLGGKARFSGTLASTAPLKARAEVAIEGPNLARLLRALADPDEADTDPLAQSYELAGQLRVEESVVRMPELEAVLGGMSVKGAGRVRLGRSPRIVANLRAQRLDLDRLLRLTPDEAGAADEAASWPVRLPWGAFRLPERLRGKITFEAGAIVYRQNVIRRGRLAASLVDGAVRLDNAAALLPGGADMTLSGRLTTPEGGPRFNGHVEAAANNLRGMFDWLGVDVSGVAKDRLRRMRFVADVRARPGRLTLTNLDVNVDTVGVTGGVAVAFGRRPGFGIGVRVDRLNVDAYLPATRPTTDSPSASGDAGGETSDGDRGVRSLLDRFDANLDIRVGTLVVDGREASKVHLKGTLSRGDLTLRTLTVAEAAGGKLRLDGTIDGVGGAVEKLNVNVSWQNARPSAALAWLGMDASLPTDWPPVSVTGLVEGTPPALKLDLALQALDGLMTAKGAVNAARGVTARTADLAVTLQHASFAELVERLTGDALADGTAEGVDLSGRLKVAGPRVKVLNLGGKLGRIQLSGLIEIGRWSPRPHIRLNLETGTLRLPPLLPDDGVFPTAGAGNWSSSPLPWDVLRAVDVELILNASRLGLGGPVTLSGAVLRARLSNGVLDITRLTGGLADGRGEAVATVDAKGTPSLSAEVTLADVAAERVLGDGLGPVKISGPLRLDAKISTKGRSERALIESLAGQGETSGELRLATDGEATPTLLAAVMGPTAARNPKLSAASAAIQVGLHDVPLALGGSWRINRGVVATDAITLAGEGVTARLSGKANLPDWRADGHVDVVRPDGDTQRPTLRTILQGPLDAPSLRVAQNTFSVPEPATPSTPSGPSTPDAPQTPDIRATEQEPSDQKAPGQKAPGQKAPGQKARGQKQTGEANDGQATASESGTDAEGGKADDDAGEAATSSTERLIDELLQDLPRGEE